MKTKRLKPAARRTEILDAGVVLAADKGFTHVTRDHIARVVGVTGPAVQYHFRTMTQLRVEIMRHAVKCRAARVVAQGLAVGDKHAAKADEALKDEARAAML